MWRENETGRWVEMEKDVWMDGIMEIREIERLLKGSKKIKDRNDWN